MIKILYIDDLETLRLIFSKKAGFYLKEIEVIVASNINEAKDLLTKHNFELVILDYHMEGHLDGIELAKYIDITYPNLKYVYASSCEKNNIVGANTETNIKKIFDVGFFSEIKKLIE